MEKGEQQNNKRQLRYREGSNKTTRDRSSREKVLIAQRAARDSLDTEKIVKEQQIVRDS